MRAMAENEIGTGVDDGACEERQGAAFLAVEDLGLFGHAGESRTFSSAMKRNDHDVGKFVSFGDEPAGGYQIVDVRRDGVVCETDERDLLPLHVQISR